MSPIQGDHPNRVFPNLMTQEWRNKVVKREKRNHYMRRYMRLYRLREKRNRAQTIRNSARRRARRREEKQKLNARRREEKQKQYSEEQKKILTENATNQQLLHPLNASPVSKRFT